MADADVGATVAPGAGAHGGDDGRHGRAQQRVSEVLGFDPFAEDETGDHEVGADEEEAITFENEQTTEELEEFLGPRYLSMGVSEIEAELAATAKENDDMAFETRVLEAWIADHEDDFIRVFGTSDPKKILRSSGKGNQDSTAKTAKSSTTLGRRGGKQRTLKTKATATNEPVFLQLSVADKTTMAQIHATNVRKQLEVVREANDTAVDELVAVVDECNATADMLAKSLHKSRVAFSSKRVLKITGQEVPTEQYYLKRQADALSTIENEALQCRMKTETAVVKIHRVKSSLARYEMEGSAQELSGLDFEKLNITVTKAVDKLAKMNERYFESKSDEHRVMHAKGKVLGVLEATEGNLRAVREEIAVRETMLDRLRKEHERLKKQIQQEKEKGAALSEKLSKWDTPNVLTYVQRSADLKGLKKERDTLRRRVEVAESNFGQQRKLWQALESRVQ